MNNEESQITIICKYTWEIWMKHPMWEFDKGVGIVSRGRGSTDILNGKKNFGCI